MESEILFTEVQRFRQWWLWLILAGVNALVLYGVLKQVGGEQQFGNNPMSNTGLLIMLALTLLVTLLFFGLHLDTQIRTDGIYVRFYPFHLSFRPHTWDKIEKAFLRQYSPIGEYGGWGLRLGLFGSGRALNVSGNMGLQLEFTDGSKLLIGTNKPGTLKEVLAGIGQLKP